MFISRPRVTAFSNAAGKPIHIPIHIPIHRAGNALAETGSGTNPRFGTVRFSSLHITISLCAVDTDMNSVNYEMPCRLSDAASATNCCKGIFRTRWTVTY